MRSKFCAFLVLLRLFPFIDVLLFRFGYIVLCVSLINILFGFSVIFLREQKTFIFFYFRSMCVFLYCVVFVCLCERETICGRFSILSRNTKSLLASYRLSVHCVNCIDKYWHLAKRGSLHAIVLIFIPNLISNFWLSISHTLFPSLSHAHVNAHSVMMMIFWFITNGEWTRSSRMTKMCFCGMFK